MSLCCGSRPPGRPNLVKPFVECDKLSNFDCDAAARLRDAAEAKLLELNAQGSSRCCVGIRAALRLI